MDIDFLVQDTYSAIRPQWKVATDLQEAASLFSEAVARNYKVQDSEKPAEPEEDDAESSSSDEGLEEDAIPEVEEEQESSDEAEVSGSRGAATICLLFQASGPNPEQNGESESDEDEQIYVARQEEERDPEAEAEFDREFEKMMSESYESRRFERKGIFDIPLPMKRTGRDTAGDNTAESSPGPNTMAFSLMTKKGNKQQVRNDHHAEEIH